MPDEFERMADRAARRAAAPDPRALRARRAAHTAAVNQITAAILLITLAAGAYIAYLWVEPYSPLNLFAPPTPFPLIVSMTPTLTPTPSATPTLTPSATLTPSPTLTPSETPSPRPSATFTPIPPEALGVTALPGSLGTPGAASTPASAPEGGYPFALIPAGLIYIANPEGRGGCNWSSIGGSVADASGAGVDGYLVRIQGDGVDEALVSGSAPDFGGGGYELRLGDQAREAVFTVTLFTPEGVQVSPPITAVTRADCANITAVRFIERAE